MKYIRKIAMLLTFLVSISCCNMSAFATQNSPNETANAAIESGCHSLDASVSYLGTKKITDNINTAIVYETNSDTLMYSLNIDDKIDPSSLVKILTALIAVEEGNTEDKVTVTQEVLDSVPDYAVSIKIVAGETMTLSDLLYCMMVGSCNDSAAVIANHVGGSQEAFVEKMNAYAKNMGCTGTHFVNVNGLYSDEQYSTTRDMAKIVSAAIKNEKFMTYFSAVNYSVPATNKSEARNLSGSNFLMSKSDVEIYFDERVEGGRTGIADNGLRCMASVASLDSMKLVCIVTGSKSTFDEDGNTITYGGFKETTALYDVAFDGYKVVQVLYENQILKQYKVSNGTNDVVLGSLTPAQSVLPVDITIDDLSYRYGADSIQFQAPISPGQKLTKVEVWHGTLCIAQADLYAMNSVGVAVSQPVVEENGFSNGITTTLIVIFAIVGVAVSVVVFVKYSGRIHSHFVKKHNAAKRRDRRRSR